MRKYILVLVFAILHFLVGFAGAQDYTYPSLSGLQPKARVSIEELRDGTLRAATLSGAFQQADTAASGYSYNLVNLRPEGRNVNLRGWRVNLTADANVGVADMQCVHGYLTLGTGDTLLTNAAVYPLSAWIDIPDNTVTGTNVVAGARIIFDPNNNALGSAAAGTESALLYGQTWASTGTIDAGIFLAAGAGSTIDTGLEFGSGTFGELIGTTSWGADTPMTILEGGPKDAAALTHFHIFVGDQTTRAAVASEVGASALGSVYMSTAGKMYICTSANTWQKVTTTAAD